MHVELCFLKICPTVGPCLRDDTGDRNYFAGGGITHQKDVIMMYELA